MIREKDQYDDLKAINKHLLIKLSVGWKGQSIVYNGICPDIVYTVQLENYMQKYVLNFLAIILMMVVFVLLIEIIMDVKWHRANV